MSEKEQLQAGQIMKYGLKLKLFVLNCGALSHERLGHDIAREFKSKLDYCDEDASNIFETILNSKFLHYSTLVFIFNGYCRCRAHILQAILFCISENVYLRYKAKLLILNHNNSCCRKPRDWVFEYCVEDDVQLNCGIYDNLIIFQNNVQNEMDISQAYLLMLTISDATPLKSIQEILKCCLRPTKHEVVRSSTNAELYFYTINPALAIIVNNYYFTSPQKVRKGSELDVVQLMRSLKIARIPYILVEDCNRAELIKIIDYIEKKDFKPLKSFLFFLMSHGDSDNVIYTYDGQLNVNIDVVNRIQSNTSLEDAEKLVVFNACRGPIDLDYALDEDVEDIRPTDAGHLQNNTIVLYSVPDRIQSPRSVDEGCPFMQSFCRHFSKIDHTDDVRRMEEHITEDLKETDYFDGFGKCSELVIKDAGKCHNIIQTPANAMAIMRLIESILKEFPTRDSDDNTAQDQSECAEEVRGGEKVAGDNDGHKIRTLFHICGTLNETKFPKISIINKYFSSEIDQD